MSFIIAICLNLLSRTSRRNQKFWNLGLGTDTQDPNLKIQKYGKNFLLGNILGTVLGRIPPKINDVF